jgi:beta-glucosidase
MSDGIDDRPPNDATYRNGGVPIDDRVADLLGRMSLEEKVAQLTSVWIEVDPERGEVAPSVMGSAFGSSLDGRAMRWHRTGH